MRTALTNRAIAWVDEHLGEFAITNEQSHPFYTIKPVAELGEAASLLINTGYADTGRAWLEHAWAQLRRGELIKHLLRGPDTLVQAAIYNPFYRVGLRDPDLEQAIADHASSASMVPILHRLPIAATLQLHGLPSPWTLEQVIADEWATRLGSPFSLSATDLYMVTHIVFYATEYARKPSALTDTQSSYLRQWMTVWIDDLRIHGQLDLIAELVTAHHCVNSSCVAPKTWEVLAANQRADGSVPYEVCDQRKIDVPGMTLAREQFLRDYHTTLVALMAGALCTH